MKPNLPTRTRQAFLNPDQLERYQQLKATVKRGRESFWQSCEAIAEIHAEKYWTEDYLTWEDFLRIEAGFTESRFRQLKRAWVFRSKMKQLADTGEPVKVPETEGEARKMMAQPPTEPEESKETSVTTVTESVNESQPPEEVSFNFDSAKLGKLAKNDGAYEPEIVDTKGKDRMGLPLPKEIADQFGRWHEMQRLLDRLRAVLAHVKAAKENRDPLYRQLTNGFYAELELPILTLKAAIPYAVCPYCQGRNIVQCTNCGHTGFVGQFFFEHMTPMELRAMRKAQIEGLKK